MIATLFVFCCYVFLYLVYYAGQRAKIDYVQWDVNNCTAADFGVTLYLTPELWEKWLLFKTEPSNKDVKFRNYVKQEVLNQVKAE